MDWLWPAIWMLPKRSVYGYWTMSGEIDLMEARGNLDYWAFNSQIGVEQFATTLHYGTSETVSRHTSSVRNSAPNAGFNQNFHLYQMEWAPTHISFSIDGELLGNTPTDEGFFKRGNFSGPNPWTNGGPNAPFDQEFYFVLNLAVGSTNGYFPEERNSNGKPWRNDAPFAHRDFWNGRTQWSSSWGWGGGRPKLGISPTFKVDFIRVYAL